jgi:hypothetical protein
MSISWYRESDCLIHINLLKLCNYNLKFTNSSLQLERRVSVWKPIDTCQKNLDYHRKGWFITVLFHWHITWVYERFDCFITVLILLRAILMISHVFLSFRVPFLWYHMGVWMIQLVYYSFGSLSTLMTHQYLFLSWMSFCDFVTVISLMVHQELFCIFIVFEIFWMLSH